MALSSATGLLIGAAYGYAAQRGAFCMNSGFRVAVTRRDFTKVKAFLLAVAISAVLLPVLFAVGLPRPAPMAFDPAAALIGGLAFGAAMKWAGGCAAGAWYKFGAGNLGAFAAFAGLSLGAVVFARLVPVAAAVGTPGPEAPRWLPPLLGAALLGGLATTAPGKAGAWSWRRTGLVIGLIALASWPLSALTGRVFGLAVVPGATAMVTAPWTAPWDVLLVLGIPFGAWIAARRDGPVRFAAVPNGTLAKAFAGGLVLGAGAWTAGGCTVGHGLAGLPLLQPQSVLTMLAIFAGSAVVALWDERRFAKAPVPSAK
jgi:uncharacterized membrane protein YedE/YeeE